MTYDVKKRITHEKKCRLTAINAYDKINHRKGSSFLTVISCMYAFIEMQKAEVQCVLINKGIYPNVERRASFKYGCAREKRKAVANAAWLSAVYNAYTGNSILHNFYV